MAYFQRALLLFCVAAVTVFHNRLVEASTAGEAAKTLSSAKENIASTEMGAHDYMLRLYHELARNGKVLNRGAVKGNQVHGFIDNGEFHLFETDSKRHFRILQAFLMLPS